jgi:capsular exopolysaccharide synthesis family protein
MKRFIKRHSAIITISTLLGIFVAAAYVFTAVPLYTGRTQIIIDPSLPQTLREPSSDGIFSIDNAQVESQLEILRSEKIAGAVIDQLKLEDNPEFNSRSSSLLSVVLQLFGSKNVIRDAFAKKRTTLARFQAGLSVRRVGLSYAIDIQFRSRNPELAAKIANATADAYVAEQIAARAQAARQGGLWLEERIDQLRKQMNQAALDAQELRAKRDYRIASSSGSASGKDRADKESGGDRHNTMEELDSTAQTYRRIYESYLMAYTESVQKQSYPITNARVITAATRPLTKSHPKTKLILAFGGLMGSLAGLGIAFFRQSIDRSVWEARQIREEIGVECLASIPCLPRPVSPLPFAQMLLRRAGTGERFKAVLEQPSAAVAATVKATFSLVGSRLTRNGPWATPAAHAVSGSGASNDEAINAVITMPFSGFSHGIKTLKTAISLAGRMRQIRCIAIASALPNEGKTTITANLGTLFAMSGVRTLLVDADLRNASLTRSLAPKAEFGLMDAIDGTAEVGRCIVRTNESGLDLLPASEAAHAAYSDEILGSEKAHHLVKELQNTYDLIIFEIPPLTASLDGLTISPMLDCTVLVAEWGKTPLPVLFEVIHLLRNSRAEILGVALNKVDTSIVRYGDVAARYHLAHTSQTPVVSGRRA